MADLPPGDAPEGAEILAGATPEDDAWVEAKLLLGTVEDHELSDPHVSVARSCSTACSTSAACGCSTASRSSSAAAARARR